MLSRLWYWLMVVSLVIVGPAYLLYLARDYIRCRRHRWRFRALATVEDRIPLAVAVGSTCGWAYAIAAAIRAGVW